MKCLKKVKRIIKLCRIVLIVLNAIVIPFALYFMISRKDLSFTNLNIGLTVIITLGIISILLATFGIAIAAYNGKKKKKRHYRLTFLYAILLSLTYINCSIIAALFVRNLNTADIVFTVLVVLFAVIQMLVSYAYAYVLKKTRTLKRLNLI